MMVPVGVGEVDGQREHCHCWQRQVRCQFIVYGADDYDNKDEDEEDIDYEVDDDLAEVSEASQRTLMG